jgi:nucleoside 2-deoxyribosyltransferase
VVVEIKAIPTHYNGHVTRSRLEARWMVFFDRLGIKFEYEPEGFVLPDGQPYLPDFRLVESDTYVEIKPMKELITPLTIYLAGTVRSDNWRDKVKPFHYDDHCFGGYPITGPSYIPGHSHDERVHGTDCLEEYRKTILCEDKAQIRQADIFFAWINSMDCYGTIAEIGYAYGLGKTIWLGMDAMLSEEERHDLWFVQEMATAIVTDDHPRTALYSFIELKPEEIKCAELSKSGSKVWLFYGEPGTDARAHEFAHGVRTKFCFDLGLHSNGLGVVRHDWRFTGTDQTPLIAAYNAARAARFGD